MIEIKQEILEQIQRSAIEDSRYLVKIINRLNPEIKKTIQTLAALDCSLQEACTIFCHCCENGLDKFKIDQVKHVDEFFKEIEEVNEGVADYITICDMAQANRLMTLITLYRIFESELEVRRL